MEQVSEIIKLWIHKESKLLCGDWTGALCLKEMFEKNKEGKVIC